MAPPLEPADICRSSPQDHARACFLICHVAAHPMVSDPRLWLPPPHSAHLLADSEMPAASGPPGKGPAPLAFLGLGGGGGGRRGRGCALDTDSVQELDLELMMENLQLWQDDPSLVTLGS